MSKFINFISFTFIILNVINVSECLKSKIASKPPMGWISSVRFGCQTDCIKYPNDCISSKLIERTANKMVSDGWREMGYKYVILDNCWQSSIRNKTSGEIMPDKTRFPQSMNELINYVHQQKLLFGLYMSAGYYSCQKFMGSWFHTTQDINTLINWNVDYVKLGACYTPKILMARRTEKFANLLAKSNRNILLACEYPRYMPWIKLKFLINWNRVENNCHSFKLFNKIHSSWESVKSIIEQFQINRHLISNITGSGQWMDFGELLLGNYGLSHDQEKVQMGMWCMFAAPLLISADLNNMNEASKNLLQNPDLIKINQDSGAHQADYATTIDGIHLWIRPLKDESSGWAIAALNFEDDGAPKFINVNLQDFVSTKYSIHSKSSLTLTDVFNKTNNTVLSLYKTFTIKINPSGIAMFTVKPNKK